ncbi:MAG: class I SAM-dependent methyltransferase [Nitrospirae bacterium]|nr:class I SAM-dependent methyltransferase [Nitrospirota bacterium]
MKQNNTLKLKWSEKRANWFRKAQRISDYPDKVIAVMEPILKDCKSALDIGAGTGALALPLAKRLKKVTAVEPAPAMVKVLKEESELQGLKNLNIIALAWEESNVGKHDIIICANLPSFVVDAPGFLEQTRSLGRYIFHIQNVNPNKDKFFYKELYPIIFKKEYAKKIDYLDSYIRFHKQGIYANVNIIEYNFDQPFDDLDEAVDFWKEYLGLETGEFDDLLQGFLKNRLKKQGGSYIFVDKKKSAVIWWKEDENK